MFTQAIEKLQFPKILNHITKYTQSSLGRERVTLLKPSSDISEIRQLHQYLQEMKTILETDDPLPVINVHDIRNIIHRSVIEGSILTGKQLLSILVTIKTSRKLKQYISKRERRYPALASLCSNLFADKVIEHHIETIINEEGDIKDNASTDLQRIRKSIRNVTDTLRKQLERILKSVSSEGMIQDEIITTRDGRMVIPVKVEFKQKVPGFIHSSSASGATVFIEPAETLEINNELREYQIQEQREIERILRTITEKIASCKDELIRMIDTLTELDVIHAKAKYSIEIIGVCPQESNSQTINLVDGRHPLLLQHHQRDEVVPLTLTLGDNYSTIIITGPNAGGKSVAMQTVGLLALMYQAGLHIPTSDETALPVFEEIFVAMGDEQSIEQDLSTFSSHLLNLKNIVSEVTNHSLVLIDEIGAGTDPVQGSAMASAILEELTAREVLTIATTHHGDLKLFAYEKEGIENGAMEFDQATLTPTYRFTAGIPGSSYALEIAERMEFPSHILTKAKSFLGSKQSKIENLLIELEQQTQLYKRQVAEMTKEKEKLEFLIENYEQKLSDLTKEIKQIKKNAAKEAQGIIERANSIIEQAVREIKESQAAPAVAAKWRDDVEGFKKEIEQQIFQKEFDTIEENTSIKLGDRVIIQDINQVGEVMENVDEEGFTNVLFGSVKMRIHRSKLKKSSEEQKEHYQREYASTITQNYPERSLDIRGLTGDEAVSKLEYFIDQAYVAEEKQVEIIHGKGSGALRKRVAEYLKKHPRVEMFRLGNWNEGGSGATIVTLKQTS